MGGQQVEPFGYDPRGSLVFASSGWFTDVLHRGDPTGAAGGDRLHGSNEENRAITGGSLLVIGTYTVDEQGVFRDEVVLGWTMPGWRGMARDRAILTETVHGDTMVERLDDGDGLVVTFEFLRATTA